MEFYRKHLLGILLCVLCWTAAAIKFCFSLYMPETKTANANYLYYFKDINETTKELVLSSKINSQLQALDIITDLIKKYDENVVMILDNNAGNYCDYYFYSPKLNNNYGIMPLSQGSNIHVAVTDMPTHVYIGTPYIDYDF